MNIDELKFEKTINLKIRLSQIYTNINKSQSYNFKDLTKLYEPSIIALQDELDRRGVSYGNCKNNKIRETGGI